MRRRTMILAAALALCAALPAQAQKRQHSSEAPEELRRKLQNLAAASPPVARKRSWLRWVVGALILAAVCAGGYAAALALRGLPPASATFAPRV